MCMAPLCGLLDHSYVVYVEQVKKALSPYVGVLVLTNLIQKVMHLEFPLSPCGINFVHSVSGRH